MTTLLETAQNFPAIIYAFVFCMGACVGSFLNVCVWRLPRGESIVNPPSHCQCGKHIAWYDNIPILSWFVLRGRARCCGAKFSFRHPLVEFLTGAIFLGMWIQLDAAHAIVGMLFASLMIFCAFFDLDTMTLPDFTTSGGALLGVFIACAFPQLYAQHLEGAPWLAQCVASATKAIVGGIVGAGTLYWVRLISGYAFGREAMGEGDVILAGCIGTFCGWQGALFAIFIGSSVGALVMLPVAMLPSMLASRSNADGGDSLKSESAKPKVEETQDTENPQTENSEDDALPAAAIPFGPWLAVGALLYMLFFRNVTVEYFARISDALFGA